MMNDDNVIASMSKKAKGEIYLGVVGAVRTGKSTFIKKFIENLVAPHINDEYEKKKCLDEMPQCAQGKIIMTTEPKFVPSAGANISIDEINTKITLVDCVGYVTPDSQGFVDENGDPRMVKSPWFEEYIPLTEAAEIGTKKVIEDHATIGIVVTTDGSITEIERKNYIEAEEKVITQLKSIGKPYIIVLNSTHPEDNQTMKLSNELKDKYDAPVICCSVDDLRENDFKNILRTALYEFPVENMNVNIPGWINVLPDNNEIKCEYLSKVKESINSIVKLKDIDKINGIYDNSKYISKGYISKFDSSEGIVTITIDAPLNLYDETLKEVMGNSKLSRSSLLNMFISYKENEEELASIKSAMRMARNTGYGIVYPSLNDMKLETPEIVKQGSRYGVKLKACASSIHMIKVDVESTFEPIIGSEEQSKEVIEYIMKDYEKDKSSIWQSEIFGRSLEQIVKEGISSKLASMPDGARNKLSTTVTKIVNKGANNLIAIVI